MADFKQSTGKSTYVWMGVSAVLLVLLIIVAVANPFGKSDELSEALVTVNGVKITKQDLYDEMYEQNGSNLLKNLVYEELIRQEAEAKKISVTEEDIDAEFERQAMVSDMSADELKNMLMFYGYSEEAIRFEMEQQVKIRRLLSDRLEITDEQIEEYYEENTSRFATPEQVRASHILVETEEEALEVISELNQGADFAKLAEERSTDPGSAANGGDLNYFSRGQMVQPFEEAAFSMEVGEITKEPVQSQHGYHIIKKTDHQAEKVSSLEEVKELITYILEDRQLMTLSQAWVTELEQNAKIEYAE